MPKLSVSSSVHAKQEQTIERNFTDMKEKHGLRWTHYRGLEKNEAQAMLVCAAMNLKKLANYLWKAKHRPFFSFAWLPILSTFFENIVYLWNKMGFRRMSETHFVNSLSREESSRLSFSLIRLFQQIF